MHGLKANRRSMHIDRRQLEEKGVILPIKRLPIRFLPGRHLLGRAGDGMRFLRSRPYDPLEDNPRDIDKFSPKFDLTVNEWEHETQAELLRLHGQSLNEQRAQGPLNAAQGANTSFFDHLLRLSGGSTLKYLSPLRTAQGDPHQQETGQSCLSSFHS